MPATLAGLHENRSQRDACVHRTHLPTNVPADPPYHLCHRLFGCPPLAGPLYHRFSWPIPGPDFRAWLTSRRLFSFLSVFLPFSHPLSVFFHSFLPFSVSMYANPASFTALSLILSTLIFYFSSFQQLFLCSPRCSCTHPACIVISARAFRSHFSTFALFLMSFAQALFSRHIPVRSIQPLHAFTRFTCLLNGHRILPLNGCSISCRAVYKSQQAQVGMAWVCGYCFTSQSCTDKW